MPAKGGCSAVLRTGINALPIQQSTRQHGRSRHSVLPPPCLPCPTFRPSGLQFNCLMMRLITIMRARPNEVGDCWQDGRHSPHGCSRREHDCQDDDDCRKVDDVGQCQGNGAGDDGEARLERDVVEPSDDDQGQDQALQRRAHSARTAPLSQGRESRQKRTTARCAAVLPPAQLARFCEGIAAWRLPHQ